ncbi:ABC transporter substrate-binding protein [Candidatus Gracilibacteria bacterium]|nr:ABC transporter substrate-binding protein [Candidatus Gracilibacteria bacterium]
MSRDKIFKLKKYLFYVSVIFVIFTFTHLLNTYLYHDSELKPIKGGNISEGIIGEYPSLNPLKAEGGNNAYLMHLLYRSLLKYDTATGKIAADIASCDISNLLRIECYLENGVKWSDGTEITANDIVATYKILQDSNISAVMSSLLANTEITQTQSSIVFTNPVKDINFLNIFFQPILPENIINNLGETQLRGNFSPSTSLYSGRFFLASVQDDSSLGVTKFFLQKNEFYNGPEVFIDQLILKLFPNINELLRNKESINIINDQDNVIDDQIPRLEPHQYTLNQYVGLFLNKDNIANANIRTFILNNIKRDNLLTILGESKFKAVKNPYFSEVSIDTQADDKNIDSIIKSLGYKRKSEIFDNFIISEKKRQNYSGEVVLASNAEAKQYSLEDFQKPAKTITSPSYVEKYNYVTQTNIVLKGKTPDNTESVYFNDIKLVGYKPGATQYSYALKDVIQPGVNDFKIYFETAGEKQLQEEVTFVHDTDKTKLDALTSQLIIDLGEAEDARIKAVTQANLDSATPFTPDPEKQALIEELDDESFYNDELEAFSFNLYYTDTSAYIEQTAAYIKTSLEEKGIEVKLNPVALSALPELLKDKSSYDIMLAGINTGYFDFNIFPYFHSSQAQLGYNFANVKKLSIDILLEELKSSLLGKKKITELQARVLESLKQEQVIKTLYTPLSNNLVDKNINNYKPLAHIPNDYVRIDTISQIYVNKKKIIDFNTKSIGGFFRYLTQVF